MVPPRPAKLGRTVVISVVLLGVAFGSLVTVAPSLAAGGVTYVAGDACAGGPTPVWGSGSTWIMYRNVTVPAGCILTIQPGVSVKANPRVHLYIDGQLLANGTPSSVTTFDTNGTAVLWTWGGIQFNRSASPSYLQYASLHQVDRALRAVRSSPTLMHDFINRANLGVTLEDSSASFGWSTINYTTLAIRINGSTSSPSVTTNTIQVVSGNPAIGILADDAGTPFILFNTIRWVNATPGLNGLAAGARGQDGGFAIAVLVNGTAMPIVNVNTIDQVNGGHGGNGQGNLNGNGGAGGNGGGAIAIAVANSPISTVESNTITNVNGGRGGTGGGSGFAGGSGGPGGAGGVAVSVETLNAATSARWYSNNARWVEGGSAGDGGKPGAVGVTGGNGGVGGDAYGLYTSKAMNGNATLNSIRNLAGGYGGNGSRGGPGGFVAGIWLYGVDGTTLIANNTISTLTGGTASNYVAPGGNATGIFAIGDGAPFNLTAVLNNTVTNLIGGSASLGGSPAATGGTATAIAVFHVQLATSNNLVQNIQGGQGGGTTTGSLNGPGGTATGLLAAILTGTSSRDHVLSVTGGAPGTGGSGSPPRIGLGLYALGNTTISTFMLLVNDTFGTIGTDDLYLDNYTSTTALNTTFASNNIIVEPAAKLTVQNFLAVKTYWPNNSTLVSGAAVTVTDNGRTAYRGAMPTGSTAWIVITNRVYVDSPVARWNVTNVSVSYLSYTFYNSPRNVNMTASQTQTFFMLDTTPPMSSANPLPTWTNTRSLTIHFTYSDGYGVGVANVTLWYSLNGGPWLAYAVQNVSNSAIGSGQFPFTAASDGTFAFATTAIDKAGNRQVPTPPTTNNTWTIVDTTVPGSAVAALPTWEQSLTFTVAWGPDPGVTDIASYAIQYNHGSGWVTWLGDTTATSALFNITALGIVNTQGVYTFRSLARDKAGNVESKSGNDTWTIVDTIPPTSSIAVLPTYEARLTFALAWGAVAGTTDVASYSIQVSDNGGAWTAWLSGVTNLTATYTGSDGHHYGFRSLATDYAGNVESKSGNDTWTIVDISPPTSAVAALSRYQTSSSFAVIWGPSGSTTDAASFTLQVSDNGGAWGTWFSGATNRSATFGGVNGHTYAFRSLAIDYAGNTESKSGNDTWTIVDTAHPDVIADAPEGAGVNLTPAIVITFSETMNTASVQQAFSLTPSINGAFSWNAAGTVLTFVPSRSLQASTTYFVNIDTSATDLAGNGLVSAKSFSFTTVAPPPIVGFDLGSVWPILVLAGAAAAIAAVVLLRRRQSGTADEASADAAKAPAVAPAKKSEAAIDDVFLLYRDGVLIKHETRRLRPDIDTDILSGMLTAVQAFVKDSFRTEEGELNELTFGEMHILIARGKWLILAAMITGGDVDSMTIQIKRAVEDMEDHHWDQLEEWDGDMELAKTFAPYVRKLIRGEYLSAGPKAELTRAVS